MTWMLKISESDFKITIHFLFTRLEEIFFLSLITWKDNWESKLEH